VEHAVRQFPSIRKLEPQAKSINPKWIDANPFGLLVI
jgi:hypothetical protein